MRMGLAAMVVAGAMAWPALLTAQEAATTEAEPSATAATAKTKCAKLDGKELGPVTCLPLPRYVTLKTNEGNARRGPGLTHRIDWVFTRAGMPLRITAEYEHWRRVEDQEGIGGWVHYSLLSGVRSVLMAQDIVEFHDQPDTQSTVVLKAERGVIARVNECLPDWCRLSVDGEKGWVQKSALWGVEPGEAIE